ncbi:NADH-quinone oxidoreductase subunit L [Halocatena marina]|uniref:NADH-quinone oxidoreductase subunit L n=1 Tax=Halocatena marina TaxID=2934937 RepID=UPI00200E02D4|nr:NADH-quinone oxidoreductase subunit L [Halocatena marina]
MAGAFEFAPAIAILPLVSFVIALFAGQYMPKKGALAGITATGGSLLLSVWMYATVLTTGHPHFEHIYTLVSIQDPFALQFGILIDQLSTLMLLIVSLISFLVFIFSLGYMNDEGETGLPRYYAELSLFSFSMLAFVMASNLFMAFMFFELVGLCSYLLIGFWFREAGPPSAAKKAFLVTRFGDYFFLIGVVAVFATFGTAAFAGDGSFPVIAEEVLAGTGGGEVHTFGFDPQTWFTIIGLLVLGGVVGKSAQFPLHTWLPDAMEGPTPVSALIHAATMVAAGVYLVARMYGFYALSPTALSIIAFVGGFTALFAATMGVVKRELKQVLAYSTISQYGYMMLALGVGGYVAGVFHLTTHAMFKALLFLGAGAVIIAMHHDEDMWKMGGLKEHLPVTYYTFLAGSLALAGILPFSGFWSKDEVLFEALLRGMNDPVFFAAYAMGLLGVFFTGLYTFRMVFLTFHGEPRTSVAKDPHLISWNMKVPLVVLGILATVIGFINMAPIAKLTGTHIDFLHSWFAHGGEALTVEHYETLLAEWAGYEAVEVSNSVMLGSAAVSLALALLGAGAAHVLYNVPEPIEHTDKLGSIKTVLFNNYYQDEYQVWLAEGVTANVAQAADTFDQGVIDGAVNGISSISLFSGSRIRRIQTGIVSNYAALLTLGLVALLLAIGLLGGWFV